METRIRLLIEKCERDGKKMIAIADYLREGLNQCHKCWETYDPAYGHFECEE